VLKLVNKDGKATRQNLAKALIVLALLAMAIFSQNLIPIHIAFIPLLVPPILHILNELRIDRRLIAAVLTFGLTAPYIIYVATIWLWIDFPRNCFYTNGTSGIDD